MAHIPHNVKKRVMIHILHLYALYVYTCTKSELCVVFVYAVRAACIRFIFGKGKENIWKRKENEIKKHKTRMHRHNLVWSRIKL